MALIQTIHKSRDGGRKSLVERSLRTQDLKGSRGEEEGERNLGKERGKVSLPVSPRFFRYSCLVTCVPSVTLSLFQS